MSSNFDITSDMRFVVWGATVWVNVLRAAFAGMVLGSLQALLLVGMGLSDPLLALLPLIYAVTFPLGLPIYLLISIACGWLASIGVPLVGLFPVLVALFFMVGDPPLFYLHRLRPDLVPLHQPRLFNITLVLFVLDRSKGLVPPLASPPVPSDQSPPVVAPSAAGTCPACSKPTVSGARFCRYCRFELSQQSAHAGLDPVSPPPPVSGALPADAPEAVTPSASASQVAWPRSAVWAALAIAVVGLAIVAAWYSPALFRQSGPDGAVLKASLEEQLPPYLGVSRFEVDAGTSVRSADGVFLVETPFRATVVLRDDTFARAGIEDGVILLERQAKRGAVVEVDGLATSRVVGGVWENELSIHQSPIPDLGEPRSAFASQTTIVMGSAEEVTFRREQQQRQKEALRRAQLEVDRLAKERQQLEYERREARRLGSHAQPVQQPRAEAVEQVPGPEPLHPSEETAREDDRASGADPAQAVPVAASGEIRKGTRFEVRLSQPLSSGSAQVEDRFEAVTTQDLVVNGLRLVPAGATLRGVVSKVEPATRTRRTGKLTLTFDQLSVGGHSYPIRARVESLSGSKSKEVAKTAGGAAIGALVGGLIGGARGVIGGLAIGGGGTLAATEGSDVNLTAGTLLQVKLESTAVIR